MKRIFLFVATNVAVLAMLGIVMNLLGIQSLLNERGTGLDLQAPMRPESAVQKSRSTTRRTRTPLLPARAATMPSSPSARGY